MTTTATVLFEKPQREIASLIRNRMSNADAIWIATGFATVEGVESIAPAILSNPARVKSFVLGAGTFRGFEALDRLLVGGVPQDNVFIHLGHSRPTGSGARHPFYRYHPMLHGKVYLMEQANGQATAFIGSHNVTGFALLGLNGEAGVMLEGPANNPEFQTIKKYILECQLQSTPYLPSMKEAFTWWTSEFIDGLRAKVNDQPRDSESKKTIVILGVANSGHVPNKGEVIYFEIPEALRQINALDAEVHIFIFDTKPPTPWEGLNSIDSARTSLWCTALGLEKEQGGRELDAQWHIPDRLNPSIVPAPQPFRPPTSPGMLQVRVKVRNNVWDRFEYLFDFDKIKWEPEFNTEATVRTDAETSHFLASLKLIPPEDRDWFQVKALRPAKNEQTPYRVAMRESSPESGSYILMSLRRRKRQEDKEPRHDQG